MKYLLIILSIFLFSCQTFEHANGDKYRVFHLRKDAFNKLSESEQKKILSSKMFMNQALIDTSALRSICINKNNLCFIFWYPCPSISPKLLYIYNELNNLKNTKCYLLVASFDSIDVNRYLEQYKVTMNNALFLDQSYGNTLLMKLITAMRILSPNTYSSEKDDIEKYYIFTTDNTRQKLFTLDSLVLDSNGKSNVYNFFD